VETILRDRNYDRVPFPQILAMVERYQGIVRVKERAQAFTEKARAIINRLTLSARVV
jgi:octaprenyl-diphosphate synthase